MVHQVKDKADFDKQLADAGSSKLVVVDFYATWCGPCKQIAPIIEAMTSESAFADVVFLKVDVDECEDIAMECQVSCMPTFVFFKNSVKVHSFSGASEPKLREAIAAKLQE